MIQREPLDTEYGLADDAERRRRKGTSGFPQVRILQELREGSRPRRPDQQGNWWERLFSGN